MISWKRAATAITIRAPAPPSQTNEGGTMVFPPGSIEQATKIKAVPSRSFPPAIRRAHRFLRPVLHVYIGDQAHYNFVSPVRMMLPYVPEMAKENGIAEPTILFARREGLSPADDRGPRSKKNVDGGCAAHVGGAGGRGRACCSCASALRVRCCRQCWWGAIRSVQTATDESLQDG